MALRPAFLRLAPTDSDCMRLRRCHTLMIEARETRALDLKALLTGNPSLRHERRWVALAAHLDSEVELDEAHLHVLGNVSSECFEDYANLVHRHGAEPIDWLLERALMVTEDGSTEAAASDHSLRQTNWRPLAAVAHRHLRWRGVNAEQARNLDALGAADTDLFTRLGEPPSAVAKRAGAPAAQRLPEPRAPTSRGLALRTTCRNFNPAQLLPLDAFAQMLHTVYGAQGQSVVSGVPVLKKNSPSAGGLHPVEAYLLVQHVEGVAPGLYHYRPDTHALEPLKALTPDEAREHASLFVARQPWFVDAHVQVILAARFQRNFWKYRNHAKAYRAVILDAGHLSQMQYLTATELGLGAFITAAINEGDIEDAFGLDPMQEGVIAVTGFGWRGERMEVLEFDPLKQVWPEWTPE